MDEDEVEFPFDLSEWMVLDDDAGETEFSPLDHSQESEGNRTTTWSSEAVLNESVKPNQQSQPEKYGSKSSNQTSKDTSKIITKDDGNKEVSTKSPSSVSNKLNSSSHGATALKNTTNSSHLLTNDAKAKLNSHKTPASPKAVSATPKAVSASPKAVSASPKTVTTTPKVISTTPKANIVSSKLVGSNLSKTPSTQPITKSTEVEVKSSLSLSKSVKTSTVQSKPIEQTIATRVSSKTDNASVTSTQASSITTSKLSVNVSTVVSTASSKPANGAAVKPESVAEIESATKTTSQTANSQFQKTTTAPLSNPGNLKSSIQTQSSSKTRLSTQIQSSDKTQLSTQAQLSNSITSQVVKTSKPDSSKPDNLTDSRPEIKSVSKPGNTATKQAPNKSVNAATSKQESTAATPSFSSPSNKSTKVQSNMTSTHHTITSSISSIPPIELTRPIVATTIGSLTQSSISKSQDNRIDKSGKTELSSTSTTQPTETVITPVVTTKPSSNLPSSSPQKVAASQQPQTVPTLKPNIQKHAKVDTESIAAVMEAVDKFNVESGRQQSFDFDGSDISDTELDDIINLDGKQKLATGGKRERTETSEPAKKKKKIDEAVVPPGPGAPDVSKPDAKKLQLPVGSLSSSIKVETFFMEKVNPENNIKGDVMASAQMSTNTPGLCLSETAHNLAPTKTVSKRIIRRFHRSTQTAIKQTENKQLQCFVKGLGSGIQPKTTIEFGVQTVGPKKPDWRDEIRNLKLVTDTVKPEIFKVVADFDINKGLQNITSVTYKYGISLGHVTMTDLEKGSFRENILFKSESFSFISSGQNIGVVNLFFTDKEGLISMMTQIRKLRIGQRYLVVTMSASLDENERDPACPLSVVKATVVFDQNFSSSGFLKYLKVSCECRSKIPEQSQITKIWTMKNHRLKKEKHENFATVLDFHSAEQRAQLSVGNPAMSLVANLHYHFSAPAWNKPKVEVVATIHNAPGGIPLDFLKIVIPDAVSLELDDKFSKFTQEGRRLLVGLTGKSGCDRVFKLLSQIYLNNEYVVHTNSTTSADRVPELKELQEARVKWQTETDLLFPASNVKDKEITALARNINLGMKNEDLSVRDAVVDMESDHVEQENKSPSELPDENISGMIGQFDSGIDTNVMEALSDISDTSNLGNDSPDKKVKLHEIASLKATLRTMAKNKPRKTELHAHKEGIKKVGPEKSKVKATIENQRSEKKVPREEEQNLRSRTQKERDRKSTSQRPDRKSVSDKKHPTDRSKRPETMRPSVRGEKRADDSVNKRKILLNEQQSHHKRQSHHIVNKAADRIKAGDRGPRTNVNAARQTSGDQKIHNKKSHNKITHNKKRNSGTFSEHIRRQSADTDFSRSRQTSDLKSKGQLPESDNTGQLMDTLLRSLSVVELSAKGEHFTRLVTEKLNNLIDGQRSGPSDLKERRWKRSRSPLRRQITRRRSASPSQSNFKSMSTSVRAKSPAVRKVFMSRKSLSPQRPPQGRMLSPRSPIQLRNHSPGRHFHDLSHPPQDSNSSARHNQNRGPSPRHHHIMSPLKRSEESGSNNLREGMWLSQPPQSYQGLDPRSNIQIVSGRNREEDLRKSQGASKNLVSIQSEWPANPPAGQTNPGTPLDGQDLLDKFIGQMKRNSQSYPTSSRTNFQDAPNLDSGRNSFGGSVNFIDSGIGLGLRNTSDLSHSGLPSVSGPYNTIRRENAEPNPTGQRFDTPYQPQAGTNMNWFGRQECKPAFEKPQETFDRSQFSGDYQQQNQNTNVPPPIPPPVAPPILTQSLSSQDRISQLEALAKQLAMDIQKQQPAHPGQPFWPFSMLQQQQNSMSSRPQSAMMGPPSQSLMMGPLSQSTMMGPTSQPSMLRGPAPIHMQGYLPQTTQSMGSQLSTPFPGANAWQKGRNF